MPRSQLQRAISTITSLAILLVGWLLVPASTTVLAQTSPSPSAGLLPPLPSSNQEVIPLAKPAGNGEIIVEEQGGGLISLKVRDASLKQVVAMIAETQRVNLIFSAPEDIYISGSLIRVPWRQALESLLASSGHTWTMDENIIIITTLTAAENIAPRAGGRRVETFELDFAKAVDADQTVKGLLSPSGKSWISESNVTSSRQSREVITVVDFPGNLQQIADYIYQIDQPPRQVLIKANILQVTLKDDCNSGVNLSQLVSFSGNQVGLTTRGFANAAALTSAFTDTTAPTGSFLTLDGGSLDGLIEALQTTTDSKSLASTELLAVSGQEARLQSGEQLGYRGATTVTDSIAVQSVEFLDVGVQLSITPHVTRDGRVLIRVKPEVSEGQRDPTLGDIPEKTTVEVETDVLLNNGQGLVIGGLIQEVDNNIQSKIPWLGDIPYAGILFQKRQLQKSRAEIIVTLLPIVMPYTPIAQAHNDCRTMRASQPIVMSPLNRAPRPYEARLPDTFTNPTPVFPKWHFRRAAKNGMIATEAATGLIPLPPVDESELFEEVTQAANTAPLLAPQQASRDFPIYR